MLMRVSVGIHGEDIEKAIEVGNIECSTNHSYEFWQHGNILGLYSFKLHCLLVTKKFRAHNFYKLVLSHDQQLELYWPFI